MRAGGSTKLMCLASEQEAGGGKWQVGLRMLVLSVGPRGDDVGEAKRRSIVIVAFLKSRSRSKSRSISSSRRRRRRRRRRGWHRGLCGSEESKNCATAMQGNVNYSSLLLFVTQVAVVGVAACCVPQKMKSKSNKSERT